MGKRVCDERPVGVHDRVGCDHELTAASGLREGTDITTPAVLTTRSVVIEPPTMEATLSK